MVFKKRVSSIKFYYIKNSVEVYRRKGVHGEKESMKIQIVEECLAEVFFKGVTMDIKFPEYSVCLDFSGCILDDDITVSVDADASQCFCQFSFHLFHIGKTFPFEGFSHTG